jgi:hypothetical protein
MWIFASEIFTALSSPSFNSSRFLDAPKSLLVIRPPDEYSPDSEINLFRNADIGFQAPQFLTPALNHAAIVSDYHSVPRSAFARERGSLKIQVNKSMSVENLRDTLRALSAEPDDECELTLPNSFANSSPFEYADYIQLVLTWGARPGPRILRVHGKGAEASLAALKSDHLQIAVSLAERIVDGSRLDITNAAFDQARQVLRRKRAIQPRAAGVSAGLKQSIIEISRFPEFSRSPDLTVRENSDSARVDMDARSLYGWIWPTSSFDTLLGKSHLGEVVVRDPSGATHIERRRWPDGHPYLEGAGEKISYRTLAERLVSIHPSARNRIRESRVRPNRPEDDLGSVLFELVQNAYSHGSVDTSGQPLASQVRIVATSTRRFDAGDCERAKLTNPDLGSWMWSQLGVQGGESAEMAVIDIVDNGIGLAKRAAALLGERGELDDGQELGYLMDALSKTTRQSSRPMSAEGLGRVQFLMTNLGGLVSIRSGRINLIRDFLKRPYNPLSKDLFNDWMSGNTKDPGAARRGTVVTIVVPTR